MAEVGRDPEIHDLLDLSIAEPDRAEATANEVIARGGDPWRLSVAHQARGIVWRDRGHHELAVAELRSGVRWGRASHDAVREADARASFGLTLAIAGRTAAGLAQLARALAGATDPQVRARILMRRGHVLYFLLARPQDALADLQAALPTFCTAGEEIWEARTLNLIGLCQLAVGDTDAATSAVQAAEDIFVREHQDVESVVTLHNRAEIARCLGDLPRALQLYDEAAERYAALGEDYWGLVRDRCEVLLAAGLTAEAVELVSGRLEAADVTPAQLAELLLLLATALLADGMHQAALSRAAEARSIFRSQGRKGWMLRAELAELLARQALGGRGRRLVDRAAKVALGLEQHVSDEAASAWLLAGRLALAIDDPEAGELLRRAADYRSRPNGLTLATSWHARALRHAADGESRAVLHDCRRGLEVLRRHQAALGSSELRALASRHGDELAALALRHAVHQGPRRFLEWSERWRATSLAQPPVRPPEDQVLTGDLAALRDTLRRLAEARADGSATAARLDDQRLQLERAIRQRTHHLAGGSAGTSWFDVAQLVGSLGESAFVELVDVDGTLHAVVARAGRVTHVVVGPTSEAEQTVAFARFALRQSARGRPTDLGYVGVRIQETLLGDAVRRLGDGPVVLSPPGRLLATPWALAPALAPVPLVVTPSAALWLRARATPKSGGRRVLVAGPGLESGGAELAGLARLHPDAVLLRDGAATVERTLDALDAASVAHLAAHGHFREDSPLFSSLDLDDGPLTVHDFQRLRRAPHRIVLSACESGAVAPIGAGEMLGLVTAMLAMGSAGVVSSVAKVNDHATADLMLEVHAAIDDGADLGEVLLRARRAAQNDQVQTATAAAFLAMGA